MRILLAFIVLAFFASCSSDKKNKEYLRKANGKPGDLVVLMDSVQWKGPLGEELRKVIEADVPGLPQGEPMFNVIWVHPSQNFEMLNEMRNMLFVFTMDQNTPGSRTLRRQFSEETLNKINSDTTFNSSTLTDEYARGQQVMYLFNKTSDGMIRYIRENKQAIADYFNRTERERIARELFRGVSGSSVSSFLVKEQKAEIKIPGGYKLADKTSDFVWWRWIDAEIDKDVFISWKPYTSEYQLLPDSLIEWRNQICQKYIYEDPEKPDTYLVTELEDAKVQARQVQLNNKFGMELRGLWRTKLRTMGGPFISYALVDDVMGRIYYIEGFVYAPGKDKREMMRELETILWTFRSRAEAPKK